ncbi:MAG TPA: ABC transporter permease, partial [Pirellulales bacterium]|nr:ABC transporter permease [Pirellulales bacterium]
MSNMPPDLPPACGSAVPPARREAGGTPAPQARAHRAGSDLPFLALMGGLGGSYILLIVAMLAADIAYTSPERWFTRNNCFVAALSKPEIQFAVRLTLISCTISALLSIWVATPLAYLLSRFQFKGRWLIDTALDVPVVLPPLVIGLSLLILFHLPIAGGNLEEWCQRYLGFRVTYQRPAVILAQFAVACAFAAQTMRVTFDQIDPRAEQVALTLGCRRSQAFLQVVLPQAWRGLIAAFTIAWARSLGE